MQRNGEVLIVAAACFQYDSNLVSYLAIGDCIGQSTVCRRHIQLGKFGIGSAADAGSTLIIPCLSGRKLRPVRCISMISAVIECQCQLLRSKIPAVARCDCYLNCCTDHLLVIRIIRREISVILYCAGLVDHRIRCIPAPCTGHIASRIGQCDLAKLLAIFRRQTRRLCIDRRSLPYCKRLSLCGVCLIIPSLTDHCVHIVGTGLQRGGGDVLPFRTAAVDPGSAVVVGHHSAIVALSFCQRRRSRCLIISVVIHEDRTALFCLVDPDCRSTGGLCIVLCIGRCEFPGSLLITRIQNSVRVVPCECTVNLTAFCRHCAGNSDVGQLFTVGNLGRSKLQCAFQLRNDLSCCFDVELQGNVLIIV